MDDVYENVMALLETRENKTIRGLSCTILEGASAGRVPTAYPSVDGTEDQQQWLEEMVKWWQRPDPALAGHVRNFNHGERIRHYLNEIDQIERAATALKDDQNTTRAVVQVVDPARDNISTSQRFPSFVSCQFLIRQTEAKLDCVAHFRKQQMRMWWPVNVAELALLQGEVISHLRVHDLRVGPGSITTIASIAVDGTNRPRVVVPRIDRLGHDSPVVLWSLAYDLFQANTHAEAAGHLEELFSDWEPTGDGEPDGNAIALGGLQLLAEACSVFNEKSGHPSGGDRLVRALKDLAQRNADFAEIEDDRSSTARAQVEYGRWVEAVGTFRNDIRSAVADLGGAFTRSGP